MRAILVCLCVVLAKAAPAQTSAAYRALEKVAVVEQKMMVPMRDGIRLATDVYRPKGDTKVPVVFSRTPYQMNGWVDGEERTRSYETALKWVEAGYAYVEQNERGRYFSEGEWDILGTPVTDGYDALTWLAEQTWSNGRVGLIGCSSTAEWQMAVASQGHPALRAMVPQGFGAGIGEVGPFHEQGNWYRGGAQQMLFTTWLYGVQHDPAAPRIAVGTPREDLLRLQRFYDLESEAPKVDWAEGLKTLPVSQILTAQHGPAGIYEEMITRAPDDPKWRRGGLYHADMPFDVPAFWFASWYDVSVGPNVALFNHVRRHATTPAVRDDQWLVIAPTLHCAYTRATENTVVGERSVGDARLNYEEQIEAFFAEHLKDSASAKTASAKTASAKTTERPRVQYFTMGKNVWQTSPTWPPAGAEPMTFYLAGEGAANSLYGDGRLESALGSPNGLKPTTTTAADTFTYDPMNPVVSHGGNVCCTGNAIQGGARDQRATEARHDVLVYTTEPFRDGLEVSGSVTATLYVSSDAKDTDFTVKLVDVAPDGTAYNLDETIQRARYREGYDKEIFMKPGEVYELTLSPMTTSNYFAPGHALRIEVSSSNFPRFERNLNTGGNNYDESEGVVARNVVHHGGEYGSKVVVEVVR